jgi:hypothetical protein
MNNSLLYTASSEPHSTGGDFRCRSELKRGKKGMRERREGRQDFGLGAHVGLHIAGD